MKTFLIVLAVIVVLVALLLSLSVKLIVDYKDGLTTKVKFLFIKKEIDIIELLSFVLFPEQAAQDVIDEKEEKKKQDDKKKENENNEGAEEKTDAPKEMKLNFIQKMWNDDGVVGIMLFVSNLLQTAGSAVTILFKGLHIWSLCVKMIIGGGDSFDVATKFGKVSGVYYPIKGVILNGMRVDHYEDIVEPDYLANYSEYEMHLIASINVRLVLKMLLGAGFVFLKNLIKNK